MTSLPRSSLSSSSNEAKALNFVDFKGPYCILPLPHFLLLPLPLPLLPLDETRALAAQVSKLTQGRHPLHQFPLPLPRPLLHHGSFDYYPNKRRNHDEEEDEEE